MIWYLPASEKPAKPLTMCENTRSRRPAEWFCGGTEGQGVPANLNYPQQAVCCVALRTQKRELISRRQPPQHLWDSLTWILMSASGPFLKNVTFWEGLNGGFRFREEFVKAAWHLMHLYKLLLKCIHKQKRFTFLNVPAAELMITEQTLNSRRLHTGFNYTQLLFAYLGLSCQRFCRDKGEADTKARYTDVRSLSNICLF